MLTCNLSSIMKYAVTNLYFDCIMHFNYAYFYIVVQILCFSASMATTLTVSDKTVRFEDHWKYLFCLNIILLS